MVCVGSELITGSLRYSGQSQSLALILIRTHEFNRASTKRQYNLPAIFQYLFNFNELFEKRLCQGTYGFSFKLKRKCDILLVLLQRAGSTNLAYETKIVDIRGTEELLLDSLRASSPARSGCGAGTGRRASNYISGI